MSDRTITKGQTLDLIYFLTDNENDINNSGEITVNDNENIENELNDIIYKEGLQWTPDSNDVGNTYTFNINGQ